MRSSRLVCTLDSDLDPEDGARGVHSDAEEFAADAVVPRRSPPAASFALAVSVETIFAGTSIVTRLLPAAHEDRRARGAPRLLIAGAALIAMAFAMFLAVTVKTHAQDAAVDGKIASDGVPTNVASRPATGAVRTLDGLFVAALLGGGLLVCLGLHRRAPERRARPRSFTIGATAEADAPVDACFISASAHELVTPAGGDYMVHPTSSMTGLVEAGGRTFTLAELSLDASEAFRLPAGGRAQITCGRTLFVIRSFPRPARLSRPRRGPDAAEVPYMIGAVVALGLFVLMISTIPPDPRALTFDLLANESRLLAFHIAPPAAPNESLPWIPEGATPSAGAPMFGASGSSGDRTVVANRNERRRVAPAAPTQPTRAISEAESLERVRGVGIIGILERQQGSHLQAILGSSSGLGDPSEADEVIGHLTGAQVGSAWGAGGIDSVGTGRGGGGTGEGVLGVGRLVTVGTRGAQASGSDYDGGVGQLGGRRRTVVPDVIPAALNVRGSLDKEIIRRIIHRHLNEVRFCYEEQLARLPHLGGRVGVQFTISGRGQVIASVLQSSTLANRAVETCTVNAVRRWEFPQPQGGGLVMVSYPFLFTPPP